MNTDPADPNDPAKTPAPDEARKDRGDDPALQGEGNVTAARRHRASAERFVREGRVGPAAEDAAPADEADAEALKRAEEAGRSHAKR